MNVRTRQCGYAAGSHSSKREDVLVLSLKGDDEEELPEVTVRANKV